MGFTLHAQYDNLQPAYRQARLSRKAFTWDLTTQKEEIRCAQRSVRVIIEFPRSALTVKSQHAPNAERKRPVDRNYDLFEILPDGSPVWKCSVNGHEAAIDQLRQLASRTENEVRIMHLGSKSVIAVLNAPAA